MRTKKTEKDFDAVKFMRQVRDKISKDLADLSTEQIMDYFKKNRPKERILPLAKG